MKLSNISLDCMVLKYVTLHYTRCMILHCITLPSIALQLNEANIPKSKIAMTT